MESQIDRFELKNCLRSDCLKSRKRNKMLRSSILKLRERLRLKTITPTNLLL